MKITRGEVFKGIIWTSSTYLMGLVDRFETNVILARLLAPEIFGIMVIVNSMRTAIEQLTDVGVGQNIIHNRKGGDQHFLDTAWTIQGIRGAFLCAAFIVMAFPLAQFFGLSILQNIFIVAGFASLIAGFTSTSIFLLDRRL